MRLGSWLCLALATALLGCTHAQRQASLPVVFEDRALGIRVTLPPGWTQASREELAALAGATPAGVVKRGSAELRLLFGIYRYDAASSRRVAAIWAADTVVPEFARHITPDRYAEMIEIRSRSDPFPSRRIDSVSISGHDFARLDTSGNQEIGEEYVGRIGDHLLLIYTRRRQDAAADGIREALESIELTREGGSQGPSSGPGHAVGRRRGTRAAENLVRRSFR
jgi:hypothetical protein